jgi:hypothetical protein
MKVKGKRGKAKGERLKKLPFSFPLSHDPTKLYLVTFNYIELLRRGKHTV